MNFKSHHHEVIPAILQKALRQAHPADHKIAVWNTFADSGLMDITDDDFSVLPRLLPASYWPIIKKNSKDITTFALRLLSLPEREIRAIVPRGPIRDFLIDELQVLKYRPRRLTGSFRYDMAIVGPPDSAHPLQLLEINEIGFDGLARSSYFQKVLLSLLPQLKGKVMSLDTAAAEVRNMQRLGQNTARVQYDCYNWDEEYLLQTAQRLGTQVHLVSPTQFGCKMDKDFPLLKQLPFSFSKGHLKLGKDFVPDAVNMSFAFALKDYKAGKDLYAQLVRSQTPQYGPFITGLVASKTILILLADPHLRKMLMGSSKAMQHSVLPAFSLEGHRDQVQQQSSQLVLKHADGCGGEQVFMDKDLVKQLKKIRPRDEHEWVLQQKTKLNTIDINGILSRPKRAIADLGVFVQYDWQDGQYRHFEVGGLMSRATNRGLKVNVSGGGAQVAVMLERGK